jgi:hypothetical protein
MDGGIRLVGSVSLCSSAEVAIELGDLLIVEISPQVVQFNLGVIWTWRGPEAGMIVPRLIVVRS